MTMMDVTRFPREMLLAMVLTMVGALIIETVYKATVTKDNDK
jgi:hypothetical protein